jgi:AcrR family transcriptional regulator
MPRTNGSSPALRRRERVEDVRVTRTKLKLSEALVELALERPFAAITVRDLTDRADVGYATFFRHYEGTEELLRAMLADLLEELLTRLRPLVREDPEAAGTLVFRHARENADLYRVLIRTSRPLGLLPTIVQVGVENLEATYRARPGSRVPLDIAANHFIRSFMDLIEWWLDHDLPYGPDRMAEIYLELIVRPIERVAIEPRS